MQAIYIGHYFTSNLLREGAARDLLEMSLRKLRKTLTDSSSSPSEEGCLGAAAKAVSHVFIIKYH